MKTVEFQPAQPAEIPTLSSEESGLSTNTMMSPPVLLQNDEADGAAQTTQQTETLALNSSGAGPSTTAQPSTSKSIQKVKEEAIHQNWMISYEDLKLGEILMQGSNGSIHSATWHGTKVAVILFDLPIGSTAAEADLSNTLLNNIKAQADMLASIRHPHIISFLAMCLNPPCMVIEHCSQGSLHDVIERCKDDRAVAAKLTWSQRLSMLMQQQVCCIFIREIPQFFTEI